MKIKVNVNFFFNLVVRGEEAKKQRSEKSRGEKRGRERGN